MRQEHLDAIAVHGKTGYPYEVCGVLLGQYSEGRVSAVVQMFNREREKPRVRYHMDAEDLMLIIQRYREAGLRAFRRGAFGDRRVRREGVMPVRVQIPAPLRPLTGGADTLEVEADDVASLVDGLEAKHKGLKDRLCDGSGAVRKYVRIFVNDEDIRLLDESSTALKSGDTVAIVPAIAGGR